MTPLERLEREVESAYGPGAHVEIDSAKARTRDVVEGTVWSSDGRRILLIVSVARSAGRAALVSALRSAVARKIEAVP